MPTKYPWFHGEFAPKIALLRSQKLPSGCSTSNGNVQCSPEAMPAKAEALARTKYGWTKPIDLKTYTLARYMTAEVGDGTVEEMVAVGEAAVNYARTRNLPQGILSLLLYRQPVGHPNRGFYGPIHGPSGVSTAPYKRWAATSLDPNMLTIALADLVISGASGNFNKGADDQDGPEAWDDHGVRKAHSAARDRSYWVGPLPGVDHLRTMQWKTDKSIHPDSPDGKALLNRALWAIKQGRPKWDPSMPVEARLALSTVAVVALGGYLAYRVMKRRK